jgi:two-component system nitrogen regulation response regulator GlnG
VSKLLVVDDEESICWGLKRLGQSMGHEVFTASSAEIALEIAQRELPDLIVLDVRLPGIDGLAAIRQFRQCAGPVPIVVITAYGDLKTAVEAVRQGAFEYILKPFDLEKIERVLTRALVKNENAAGHGTPSHVAGFIGRSDVMQETFKRIALAAASNVSILLYGESGTGKELAARAIHQFSDRTEGPFVAVNLASLSPSLAESELFGHVSGAFTGADGDRAGLLVQADRGTLFLDEVADIPLPAQVRLLRALEHGEVVPVGSGQAVATDFRVVSATHQNLSERIKMGRFRHDLFFRLCAFRIDIPPLRARGNDVRELAECFLAQTSTGCLATAPLLTDATVAELKRRPWHGNVRELRNAIEHAVIIARGGAIEPDHLPEPAASPVPASEQEPPIEQSVAERIESWAQAALEDENARDLYDQLLRLVEPPLLTAAMSQHQGQCAAAARQLGLHRTTLRKKLDQYDLDQKIP